MKRVFWKELQIARRARLRPHRLHCRGRAPGAGRDPGGCTGLANRRAGAGARGVREACPGRPGDEGPRRLPGGRSVMTSSGGGPACPPSTCTAASPWSPAPAAGWASRSHGRSRPAGADIVGVSASLESSGSEVQAEVEGLGREFEGHRDRLRRPGRGRRARRATGRRPSGRHPGQQCGHHRAGARRRSHGRVLGPGHRGRPVQPVRADPRGRAADGLPRRREGDLHRLDAELPGRGERGELHGCQECHRRC